MSAQRKPNPWQAQRRLIREVDCTSPAKLLLYLLVDHLQPDGLSSPGVRRLAKEAALGRSTVFKHLQNLETRGHISGTRHATRNGDTTAYRVHIWTGGVA